MDFQVGIDALEPILEWSRIQLARIIHESVSRDRKTGNPLAGLSGAQRARIRWPFHLGNHRGLNPRRT